MGNTFSWKEIQNLGLINSFLKKKKVVNGVNIMAWRKISNEGSETIHWINKHEKRLNADSYIDLLSY